MVIEHLGVARKALAVYERQKLYADRTARIKAYKTFQVGVVDRVTLSVEATANLAASAPAHPKERPAKSITYEDPRKTRVIGNQAPAPATPRALSAR